MARKHIPLRPDQAKETIALLMQEQGISQGEMARRLGVTNSYVNQVMTGHRGMSQTTVERFANVLGYEFEGRLVPRERGKDADQDPGKEGRRSQTKPNRRRTGGVRPR